MAWASDFRRPKLNSSLTSPVNWLLVAVATASSRRDMWELSERRLEAAATARDVGIDLDAADEVWEKRPPVSTSETRPTPTVAAASSRREVRVERTAAGSRRYVLPGWQCETEGTSRV